AESLARIAAFCIARRQEILATGLAGRSSQLRRRIERLLRQGATPPATPAPQPSRVRVALFAAALTMIVAAGPYAPRWIAFAQAAPSLGALANGPASGVAGGVSGEIAGGVAGPAVPLGAGPVNAPLSASVRPAAPAIPAPSDVLQGPGGALSTPQQMDP